MTDASAEPIRAALAARVALDAAHQPLREAARSAGMQDTDSFLCYLSRSVSAGLQAVSVSAESAQASLGEARAAFVACINADFSESADRLDAERAANERCDELASQIDSARAAKVVSLEHELCAIDEAIARWRTACGAANDAVASLGDAELVLKHGELSSCLAAAEALLRALPVVAPFEPPYIGIVDIDAIPRPVGGIPALLSQISSFGRVIAPRAISAADVEIVVPSSYAWPGALVEVRLAPGAAHCAQSTEELEGSLRALVAAARVDVTLSPGDALLDAAAPLSVREGYVLAEFRVPMTAPAGAAIRVSAVSVAGLPSPRCVLPPIPVRRGMQAPLSNVTPELEEDIESFPCISPGGVLYAPCFACPDVFVVDADGTPLPSLPLARLGLTLSTFFSAYVGGDASALLLADGSVVTRLVSIDPRSGLVRWATASDTSSGGGCTGLVVLPEQGVAVVSNCKTRELHAHSLSDGVCLGSVETPRGCRVLAADPSTGTLYVGVNAHSSVLHAWSWSSGPDLFTPLGPVAAAGADAFQLAAAVVPPALGRSRSHLVVGAVDTPELRVLALPDLTLVHTHTLDGMLLKSLAADPWGTGLVVCDYTSNAVHVLAWPLPGMPALE